MKLGSPFAFRSAEQIQRARDFASEERERKARERIVEAQQRAEAKAFGDDVLGRQQDLNQARGMLGGLFKGAQANDTALRNQDLTAGREAAGSFLARVNDHRDRVSDLTAGREKAGSLLGAVFGDRAAREQDLDEAKSLYQSQLASRGGGEGGLGILEKVPGAVSDFAGYVAEGAANTPLYSTSTPMRRGNDVTMLEAATHPIIPDRYVEQIPNESVRETVRGLNNPIGVAGLAIAPGAVAAGAGAGIAAGNVGAIADRAGVPETPLGDWQSTAMLAGDVLGGPRAGRIANRLATEVEGAVPPLRNRALRNAGFPEGIRGADDVGEMADALDDIPMTADDAVARIQQAITERKAGNKLTAVDQSAERTARRNASEDAYWEALDGGASRGEARRIKRGIQSGELPSAKYEPIEMPEDAWEAMHTKNDDFDFGRGMGPDDERDRVRDALNALEEGTHIPDNELNSLGKVFPELAETIRKNSVKDGKGFWDFMYQLAVTPKAIRSSLDISYPLRQGILLAVPHPVEWAQSWVPMLRAGAKETNAIKLFNDAANDSRVLRFADGTTQTRGTIKQDGLLRSLDAGSEAAEESFRSNLAERWTRPMGNFVRRSNRAFATFGNELRSKTFDTIVDSWERRGIKYTQSDVESLRDMLNRFTGRGKLGNDAITKAAQVILWSPQQRAAPFQAAGHLLNYRHPQVAREAWRNWASTLAAGGSILSLAHLAGFEVTLDPRSSDFGKIVVGDTHINIWGPMQPLTRTIAQIASGMKEGNPTGGLLSGEAFDVRKDAALGYARSGLAPEWAALVDVWTEKDYLGNPVKVPASLGEGVDFAFDQILPLAMSDAYDAFKEYGMGPEAAASFLYSEIGGTASTYPNYDDSVQGQLWEMPRYEGVPKEQEQELFDFLDEVGVMYEQVNKVEKVATEAQVAASLGKLSGRPEIAAVAVQYLKGDLQPNFERLAYIINNQDDMPDNALDDLPREVAGKRLTAENYDRYANARGQN